MRMQPDDWRQTRLLYNTRLGDILQQLNVWPEQPLNGFGGTAWDSNHA